MNNVLQNIISLFSTVHINEDDITEDYSEVKVVVSCDNGKCPTKREFEGVLRNVNGRDSLHLSVLQNGEIVQNYYSASADDFDGFINACQSCFRSNNFIITATIVKSTSASMVSVYYANRFLSYLSSRSVEHFLEIISRLLNGNDSIIFEVQDEAFTLFSTRSIKFISIGGCEISCRNRDISHLDKTKNICHSSVIDRYKLVPDDFYPIVKNGTSLDDIFGRMALLYSAIFLFDVFEIKCNHIEYKLNGYRTISSIIGYFDIDITSHDLYYKIYDWVYDGGNIIDKIGLARNILSLNFDKDDLKIAETTFEAIRSSFSIYQKENIKQYIDLRNKISDQLIELQNKADKIVENFVSEFKKSFIAIISFFASVLVIRVVSKGDFAEAFTAEVAVLSVVFLMIFLFILIYARWEIGKQIIKYIEFYYNLKDRHRDLLDKSDIDRILNYDVDFNSNKQFIEERRDKYTLLWVVSLVLLFIATVVLFLINLTSSK